MSNLTRYIRQINLTLVRKLDFICYFELFLLSLVANFAFSAICIPFLGIQFGLEFGVGRFTRALAPISFFFLIFLYQFAKNFLDAIMLSRKGVVGIAGLCVLMYLVYKFFGNVRIVENAFVEGAKIAQNSIDKTLINTFYEASYFENLHSTLIYPVLTSGLYLVFNLPRIKLHSRILSAGLLASIVGLSGFSLKQGIHVNFETSLSDRFRAPLVRWHSGHLTSRIFTWFSSASYYILHHS